MGALVVAGAATTVALANRPAPPARHTASAERVVASTTPSTAASTTTAPTTTAAADTVPPTTAPPVGGPPTRTAGAVPGPGAPAPCPHTPVPGGAYVVGDSVMLDAQQPLQACVPGIGVDAAVSRQWTDGEAVMRSAMASAHPAEVVVDLGTNGPITDADVDAMMSIVRPATRVVFVTVHVDRPWQGPNNAVLVRGVLRYPNTVLADWEAVAAQHPEWFYADGTHLPVNGPGAQALADLIADRL